MGKIWVEEYKGFLYDVPVVDFIRCDGTPYHYENVSTSDANFSSESTPINGGWGKLPIGFIETGSTQEITLTSAEFGLDMFEMANATKITKGDYSTFEINLFTIEAGVKAVLPFEVQTGSVKIRGMEETTETTPTTGKFKVTVTAATENADGKTEVVFAADDAAVGDDVRIGYKRRVVNGDRVVVKTESTTAKGELYLHYPISSSGEDCTEKSIKGYLHIYFPKVRATALPSLSTSYKSNATPSVTFSGMDPKRADKKGYELIYEELDADTGDIVAKSGATVDWT